MGMDNGGPSAMGLYASAGGESVPADTGLGMGRSLYDAELAARARYAEPSMGPGETQMTGSVENLNASNYNFQPALPVKYQVPSAMKERMVARQAIRRHAGDGLGIAKGVIRTDAISDEEVSYLQAMQDQAELADFDRYVNSLVDPRKPGNLKWLMEIYPDFVNRRIQQVHTDYEYALRGQMIDSWGINTFDDLHFKYLQDQGKIKGPYLANVAAPGKGYNSGLLAPAAFKSERKQGVRLPFASAQVGASAPNEGGWTMGDPGQPLAGSRGINTLATEMFKENIDPNAEQVYNEQRDSGVATRRMFPRPAAAPAAQ